LRLIATTAPDKIIFKGGTSLAKGWNLIQRFSEDIDIFLDTLAFKPRLEASPWEERHRSRT
jgi:predicted nucleotidyltransferase component of viral defense system